MAQQFITDAGALIIPGAYPSIKVQTGTSGLSTTGVLALVGEADAGPDYSLEDDLQDNSFGPDALADVVAKYKTGTLVDAFRGACVPASDPDIVGAPSRIILVKTNASAKATANLLKIGGGTYSVLQDKSYGKMGNLIYWTVAQHTAEVKPTTSSFTFIPAVGSVDADIRVNGGAALAFSLLANDTPTAAVAAIDALADVSATGGASRGLVGVAGTLAVAATGNVVTITRSIAWTGAPVVGDTLIIPEDSVIEDATVGAGGTSDNVGAYVITAVGAASLTATKLSDAGKPGAVIGTITPPVNVTAQAIVSASADIMAYSPVTITQTSSTVVDGLGKTLEINSLTTGTDLLTRTAFVLGTITAVSWISTAATPTVLESAAEYRVTLNVLRQVDDVNEALTAGGQIAFKMGYDGTTCAVTITPTALTTTVAGGSGANLSITLADYPTLNDLVAFIGAQTGYTASVGSAAVGQVASTALDESTYTAGTTHGAKTLRVKLDAVRFWQAITNGSNTVELATDATTASLAGIPAVAATPTYLSGGTRGATTNASFQLAVDALEAVRCNFVVPLFSRNATDDVADALTDSGSTYTIAAINAYAKTHCLAMSTLKRRRNRQAFCSQSSTFDAVKESASGLASYRVSLAFQDCKDTGSAGIVQYQPWMTAVKAAGMQAAGFYRAIFNKGVNCSGFLQAAGDFRELLDSDVEDALLAGLLPARRSEEGGFKFVSDQTTYLKDDNFVFNSIQAVYVADTIALTTAQRMERAFVGQSVADVSAAVALSALEGIMADFLRLKLIAVSDDAPKGFKNARIRISGTSMQVSVEIKLAGAIYFIPISFLVSQVTQAAA